LRQPTWRGLLHELMVMPALVATAWVVTAATGPLERIALAVHGLSMAALFALSATYHRHSPSLAARRITRKLDHSAIFVLIAGSYTPICLLVLDRPLGFVVLAVVWLIAAHGVRQKSIRLGLDHDRVHSWMYVVLGGTAILILPQLVDGMGWARVLWSAGSGLLYGFGGWVLVKRRIDPWPKSFGFHEVWHACVTVAIAINFGVAATLP